MKPHVFYHNQDFLNFRIRLISLAAQKFISDIINDSLQHSKLRNITLNTRKGVKVRHLV